MEKSMLFVEKVSGCVRSVKLAVDMLVTTDAQGIINQEVDLIDKLMETISVSTAGIEGETIDEGWVRVNLSGDDLYNLMINDVEGPDGEWLGSDGATCTIVGPIETEVMLDGQPIRITGIDDEEGLGMSTRVRVTSGPLKPNVNYMLLCDVQVSTQ